MSAKNALAIQRCELSRKELDEFLSFYPIPSEYRVILPTSTQTILDAPPEYIDIIVPSKSPQLLLKENMLDVKSFKDKSFGYIEHYPLFQPCRYPFSSRAFDDPILFLVGLQSSWKHGQQRPAIFVGGKEMSFRNFIYTEEDEDLTFLPKDFLQVLILAPLLRFRGSPKGDTFVVHAGSVAARIRERKCKTRGGSSRPPVKRKLASGSSTSRTVRAKASAMKDDTPVLSISDDDEGLEDLNRRSCELLEVIKKLRGEADVMRARELAREEECEGLRAKCEAAMTDFDKNPTVLLLRVKMSLLAAESQRSLLWKPRRPILRLLRLRFANRREVVSKVIPYACMELLHSDELGRLVGKLVSSAITFGRCRAYEQVARMKEPFDLSKVKRYRPSYEKEHTQASNDLATATFSWLNKYVADASTSVEALLSKKPPTLQKPIPSRT
ncbi:hypothetical protein Tco_1403746 [Tanacetum coccineum]